MPRSMIAVLALLASASTTSAATLPVLGIPSFNTALGTLTKATVTIDPLPVATSEYQTFASIPTHNHTVLTPAIQIPGLASFPFATVFTSHEGSGIGGTHDHSVDILPSVKVFTGAQLNWFLNPANGVNSILFPTINILEEENHTHTASIGPVTPMTLFEFTPVSIPEPSSLVLLAVTLLVPTRRHQR